MRAGVIRVQDSEGRGPYRPGVSSKWTDLEGPPPPPTFIEEFGHGLIKQMNIIISCSGGSFGCGFRSLDQMHRWFSTGELERLEDLGYRVVTIDADRILAESDHQLVFWRSLPLWIGAKHFETRKRLAENQPGFQR